MDLDDFDDIFINDDLDILDIIDYGFPRKIRFRLTKNTVLYLLSLIEENLEFDNDLNNSVAPIDQLLTALRFYASAGHLSTVADFIGMDISTASRIVAKVSLAIGRLYQQFIKMPGQKNLVKTQSNFYNNASFPRVIGCVDGTHIKIQSPGGEDPEVFRNRKGYFLINCDCDSELMLLDVVAHWPGSVHDSTIFNSSRLRRTFENNEFPNCILLGDSGYMLKNHLLLLTPLADPATRGESLYNEAHIRTRNTIERCFGVWKRRFPVLAYGLRLKLRTSLHVIVATAVLHNIAKRMHEEEPPLPDDIIEEEIEYLITIGNVGNVPNVNNGIHVNDFRNQLIIDHFSRL